MSFRIAIVLAMTFVCLRAHAQTPDPADQPLERAYQALREKNYDQAIAGFKQAITLAADRASIRKDLAYTLLKVGRMKARATNLGKPCVWIPPIST